MVTEVAIMADFVSRSQQQTVIPTTLSQRKRIFLNELSSSGKNKYKRYIASPLRYAGGKSLAVGLIVELIPEDTERIVSPFLGGGAVEIAIANELDLPIICYDVFDILTNYWKVQLKNQKRLYKGLSQLEPTREEYKRVKVILKKHWDGEEKLNRYDLATYYYFNHNTSYGPHFLGSPSSVYLQPKRYKKMIEKVRDFRAPNMHVECASFEKTMPKYKKDFLYCDPPYYLNGDSKTFIGMYPHRNFPIHHNNFDHEKLRDLLIEHEGGFVLSYNDCSTIREWYKDFNIMEPSWQYTFSQGDTRIGINRLKNNNGSHVKKSHELLIWNLPKQ